MSIEQVADATPGWEWFPPGPWAQPVEWAELDDAMEESLLEADACGDVGFADRLEGCWWADDTVPPGWVPADPLEGWGRVAWLQACGERLSREHARFLAAVHQAGHAQELSDDSGHPRRDEFACDEVGKALGHSTSMAGTWLSLAEAVIERLPRLYAAMAAGWLDLAKARVLVDDTHAMPDDLARMVVSRVLPLAADLTKKQLEERIEITAGQLDPDWYRRREQAALARARVEWTRTPAGTGEVALRDVSVPAAAAIKARVEALAEPLRRAARAAGLRLGLPALRALACQRLLDGTHAGLDDDALLARLVEDLPAWHAEITGDDDPGNGPDDGGGPGDGGGPDDGGGPGDGGGPDDGGAPDDGGPGDGGPGDGGPDDDAPDGAPAGASGTEGSARAEEGRPIAVRAGVLELRMRLSTALGRDDLPGELPGSGPLTASRARRMLADTRRGATPSEWRVVLVDEHGHLEYVLLARPDPPARPRRGEQAERLVRGRVIVEMAAPTTMLAALDPTGHPGWATLISHAQAQLAGLGEQGAQVGGAHHPATSTADAHRRFPGAALERFVRVRDRSCVGVLCTGAAHRAEIDHTRDWAVFGLTVAGNLGPPCRHCHRLKHDGGWHLSQPAPGAFTWRSPLGATYTVHARRVLEPALEPAPRADRRPRLVLDATRTARPLPGGWLRRRTRLPEPDDLPAPRGSRIAIRYVDEPPF